MADRTLVKTEGGYSGLGAQCKGQVQTLRICNSHSMLLSSRRAVVIQGRMSVDWTPIQGEVEQRHLKLVLRQLT